MGGSVADTSAARVALRSVFPLTFFHRPPAEGLPIMGCFSAREGAMQALQQYVDRGVMLCPPDDALSSARRSGGIELAAGGGSHGEPEPVEPSVVVERC